MKWVITLIIRIQKFSDLRIVFGFSFIPQKKIRSSIAKVIMITQWPIDTMTMLTWWRLFRRLLTVWYIIKFNVSPIENRQCMRWSAEDSQGTQCLVTPAGPHISSVSAVVKMWRGPVSEHDCAEKPPYRRTTTARPRTRHCGDLTNNNTTAATPQQTRRFLPLFRNLETSNIGDFITR